MQTPILAVNSLPDTTDRYFCGLLVNTKPWIDSIKLQYEYFEIWENTHINLYNVQLTWLIYHLVSPDTPMISADVIALQCPVIARLPVTPKHQRINLTPALPSRTVSSDTAIHQEKHDISTTTLFFRNWPTSEPLYNLLHYTQTKNVHHPTESPSPTTLIHTTKNDITSKGHSWHLTTRWPFCISSLEVPPQVGGWQWQHRSLWAKVVAAKLQDHWNKIDLLPPYLHLSPFLKLNASDSHLGTSSPGKIITAKSQSIHPKQYWRWWSRSCWLQWKWNVPSNLADFWR